MEPPDAFGERRGRVERIAAADRAGDDELSHVDPLQGRRLVEHRPVRRFPGEGGGCAGDPAIGRGGARPVDEEDRARAALQHAGQHLPGRGGESEYREPDGGPEVLDRGFEHQLQEIGAGHGAELHHLDGAEVLGRTSERPCEGGPVAHVRDVASRCDAVGGEALLQCFELGRVAGDEGDGEALAAELAGHGGPEPGAGADNGDSHVSHRRVAGPARGRP